MQEREDFVAHLAEQAEKKAKAEKAKAEKIAKDKAKKAKATAKETE